MTITNIELYNTYKEKNQDPYGATVIRHVDAWGTLMEEEFEKSGDSIEDFFS